MSIVVENSTVLSALTEKLAKDTKVNLMDRLRELKLI